MHLHNPPPTYPTECTPPFIAGVSEPTLKSTPQGEMWIGVRKGRHVVVKPLRRLSSPGTSNKRLQRLAKEALAWQKLNHPNIATFYGIAPVGPYGLALVSQWNEESDVLKYLTQNPAAPRMSLVLDILQGLRYLHSQQPPIVHGDLKGTNVLVNPSGQACLADFGLARVRLERSEDLEIDDSDVSYRRARWTAPELLDPDSYGFRQACQALTPASDMYSVSMVFYEIYTGRIPFYETRNHFRIPEMVEDNKRPSRPGKEAEVAGFSDDMWLVMQQCWDREPSKRLSAHVVIQHLFHWKPDQSDLSYSEKDRLSVLEYPANRSWSSFFVQSLPAPYAQMAARVIGWIHSLISWTGLYSDVRT